MVVSLLAMTVLLAPMPGEDEAERFKLYFEKGEALYQKAEYGMAVHFFRLADARRVTPEVAFDLAKCHEKLNDPAFALYYYRLYMRRAPQAPDTLAVAEKVGAILGRLGSEKKGFVELEAPRAGAITIGGMTYPESPVAAFLAPGDHDITALFGATKKTMRVQVKSGQAVTLGFEPVRPPLLAMEMALPAEAVARGVESAADLGTPKSRLAAWALVGASALALGVGTYFGLSSSADLAEARTNKKLKVAQAKALVEGSNQKGIVANVLFGVGGAAGVGAAVLFIFPLPEPGMKNKDGASP